MEKARAWPEAEFFIDNVPDEIWGEVGDNCVNWVYQQGFFAALIKCFSQNESLKIIDFGCGHGKLAPISVFFTHPQGEYLGVDINGSYINYCNRKYAQLPRVKFHVSNDYNPLYSPKQQSAGAGSRAYGEDWPVAADSVDVLIAVSIFTHLQETDAFGYVNKIYTILKPNALAMLTCHIVEEPRKQPGFIFNYNPFLVSLFRFATPLPTSNNWFTSNPALPESGIAINMAGLNSLIQGKFKIELIMRGSATGGQDPFPQDVVVLRKLTG
ncbi:MAG TPA: class I SAM-dependent methyltransferase [Dehalococcoidia bacterium]|nr:class I SAM-dependent methyltransferase [Dehalococcoidia bacterium]